MPNQPQKSQSLKEWADALERELKPLDDLPPSIQSQANIRLINSARALIRSALSSPVGGTEERTPSSNVAEYVERAAELVKSSPPDFADKDQHIEWGGEAFVLLEELAATRLNELPPISDVLERIAADISALTLHPTTNVEYDAGYIGGRGDAFAIVQEAIDNLPASPTPASDIAALREYAHEATKVITGLAGGGSENFSGQIGDMFKADLEFCAKKIRDRHEMIHGLVIKAKKENDALKAELACTYEELINHNGDDLNDTRAQRVAELRSLQHVAKGEQG